MACVRLPDQRFGEFLQKIMVWKVQNREFIVGKSRLFLGTILSFWVLVNSGASQWHAEHAEHAGEIDKKPKNDENW